MDLNPDFIGSSVDTFFTDPNWGRRYYKVRAVGAAGQSAFSNEIDISACSITGEHYTVGDFPQDVITGDFNKDGLLDLVVTNATGNSVSILPGIEDTSETNDKFAAAVNYNVGPRPEAIIGEDFNEDGITDLAVAISGSSHVSILFGEWQNGVGNGIFTAPIYLYAGFLPRGLISADFNKDGIADLAVTTLSANGAISVLIGQGSNGIGNGEFANRVFYEVGSGPNSLTTGDFNEDGIPDLV